MDALANHDATADAPSSIKRPYCNLIDINMKSIKLGLERLREERVRAQELDEAAMMGDVDE